MRPLTLDEQPFVMRDLIAHVVAGARAMAADNADLDVSAHIEDVVPDALIGDRAKIHQILDNLLSNAVRCTPRGYVALIVGVRDLAPDAVMLDISVSDSGVGITPDGMRRIFAEVPLTDDDLAQKERGHGRGLAICRTLLALYQSDLEISSNVERGTTLSFSLVLARPRE